MTGAGHSRGSDGAVSLWARQYRADARSDSYRATLRTLSLGHDQPTVAQARRAIRENIELVALAASFKWLDNPAADATVLLASVPSQRFVDEYSGARRPDGQARRARIPRVFARGATPPAGMPRPEYVNESLTRDTGQTYNAEASPCRYLVLFLEYDDSTRWLLLDDLSEIDLADQVAAGELTAPTVAQIRIRHPGGQPFVRGEHARLEKAVAHDLRFDFDEDELSIEFNRYPTGLQVMLEGHREP